MPSKRVWHLCSNRWNSAITEYALSAAKAMELAGWSSSFSPLAGSPAASRAESLALVGAAFASFGFRDLARLRAEARRLQPQLIVLYGGPETFLSRALQGIPRVRFRGQDSDGQAVLSPRRLRLALSHCAAVLTPAQGLASRFQTVFPERPVFAVPLGLDPQRFRFEKAAWAASQRPTLRILGRLDPIKGHATFFAHYQRLLQVWPAALPRPWLEVVGEPANLSAATVRQQAQQAGLLEGQDWQLRCERMAPAAWSRLLASTHLGVISSLGSEIICRVAEEFLLAGCPLLVSGVGSLEECLFDEAAGASYRGCSPEATRELLQGRLLAAFAENEGQRQARAETARARFSLAVMGEALSAALSPLIKI